MVQDNSEQSTAESQQGVGIPNVICYNDHGQSGQIMEKMRLGGFECPECGRNAWYKLEWGESRE